MRQGYGNTQTLIIFVAIASLVFKLISKLYHLKYKRDMILNLPRLYI